MKKMNYRLGAFTLTELLVVVAILAILVSMLMPAIEASLEYADETSCLNNMKQVGSAATMCSYVQSNKYNSGTASEVDYGDKMLWHDNKKPWANVFFGDGHSKYIEMLQNYNGATNSRLGPDWKFYAIDFQKTRYL